MGPDDLSVFREGERVAATDTLLRLTPKGPDTIRYQALWPMVLARHVVRKTDVNKIVAQLRQAGKLLIPDWEKGRQVPQPAYRIQRSN
jgi:hypothetical protein